jgi:3-phosphoinositide dependent protein kinase-1
MGDERNEDSPDGPRKRKQKSRAPQRRQLTDFVLGKLVAEGSYGRVIRAEDSTHRPYVIKIIPKSQCKNFDSVKSERYAMIRLSHPNIVHLCYTFQDRECFYFVEDFLPNGDIASALRTHQIGAEETKRLLAQVLLAIKHMHSHRVVHRDLKPANILLDSENRAHICDFGSCKIYAENEDMDELTQSAFVGSPAYIAPEMLGNKVCAASDLWAFGCLVYYLLVGSDPFRAETVYWVFQKIREARIQIPDGVCKEGRDLIKKLLVIDPRERLSIQEIQTHCFFEGLNWEEVPMMTIELRPRIANSQNGGRACEKEAELEGTGVEMKISRSESKHHNPKVAQ